jgi:large subunit ribosomal protein L2
MGKNLIQQKRGKGSPTYRAPSFRYAGKVNYPKAQEKGAEGEIVEIMHSQGHSAPLMIVKYMDEYNLNVAPEGIRVGDKVAFKTEAVEPGNIMELANVPEGTAVFNIESKPGDGGKFVRTSGGTARIVSKTKDRIIVRLPSKKNKEFSPSCLATIGIVAGSGRTEKPFLKAGNKYHRMRARNKLWPSVGGVSMNAVDHPFGSKSSHTKGRPTQASRNAPPGRKVGKIAPKRTGRKK